jgi:pyruvate formate lyase activating enzyme
MKIAGLQKVSLIDYPGKISCIVFTQGCNFRCPYCHNPELVCPDRYGPLIAEEDIFSFLNQRKGKLEAISVTGGEPTLQPDLEKFFQTIKSMGYLAKIDTNGSNPSFLKRLIDKELVNYIAMDVKGPLKKYGEITSAPVDIGAIKRSIEIITTSGAEHEFRTTVVKSQLDTRDLIATAKLLKNARLYVLQAFVPRKTLDAAFLSETSYLPQEFSTIKNRLEREGIPVEVR